MTENTQTVEATAEGTAEPTASEQAIQVVDRAVGTVPAVADAVRKTFEEWRDPETRAKELKALEERGADVRRQVTDQVVERARKARERVEPTVRRVRERS
jgi:sirohydrochlorin ferrochelatase